MVQNLKETQRKWLSVHRNSSKWSSEDSSSPLQKDQGPQWQVRCVKEMWILLNFILNCNEEMHLRKLVF